MTPAKPTSRSPASPTASSKEPPLRAGVGLVVADQVDVDDRVVGAQAQVAQLAAQPVDLGGHEVEPDAQRLRLHIRVGLFEAAQQAAALGARGLEAVQRGHEVARHVLPALALRADGGELGQVAQRVLELVRGDAQLEGAAGAGVAAVELGAQHEAAVARGHAVHVAGQRGDLVVGRRQGQRHRALDAPRAPAGDEVLARAPGGQRVLRRFRLGEGGLRAGLGRGGSAPGGLGARSHGTPAAVAARPPRCRCLSLGSAAKITTAISSSGPTTPATRRQIHPRKKGQPPARGALAREARIHARPQIARELGSRLRGVGAAAPAPAPAARG